VSRTVGGRTSLSTRTRPTESTYSHTGFVTAGDPTFLQRTDRPVLLIGQAMRVRQILRSGQPSEGRPTLPGPEARLTSAHRATAGLGGPARCLRDAVERHVVDHDDSAHYCVPP
jgi:hypothetical protein